LIKKTQNLIAEKKKLAKLRKTQLRTQWFNKFTKRLLSIHKQYTKSTVARLLTRIDRAVPQIQTRSKKLNVECKLTVAQLRKLIYDSYGQPCKFCSRILVNNNFVLDHKIPISKGGTSNVDNLQLICKSCNGRKGSLLEEDYMNLLKWLETQPEDVKRNILMRMAGGRC
jgi:hypothetical protein